MVYYRANSVWQQDAFLVICTISSSPAVPVLPPVLPRQLVPKDLVDAMGSLLDEYVHVVAKVDYPTERYPAQCTQI